MALSLILSHLSPQKECSTLQAAPKILKMFDALSLFVQYSLNESPTAVGTLDAAL